MIPIHFLADATIYNATTSVEETFTAFTDMMPAILTIMVFAIILAIVASFVGSLETTESSEDESTIKKSKQTYKEYVDERLAIEKEMR